MGHLTKEIYDHCRKTLLECEEFYNLASLQSIFSVGDLRPFRTRLPDTTSAQDRVDWVLTHLIDKKASTGDFVLPTFLETLAERYNGNPPLELYGILLGLARQTRIVLNAPNNPVNGTNNGQDEVEKVQVPVQEPPSQTKVFPIRIKPYIGLIGLFSILLLMCALSIATIYWLLRDDISNGQVRMGTVTTTALPSGSALAVLPTKIPAITSMPSLTPESRTPIEDTNPDLTQPPIVTTPPSPTVTTPPPPIVTTPPSPTVTIPPPPIVTTPPSPTVTNPPSSTTTITPSPTNMPTPSVILLDNFEEYGTPSLFDVNGVDQSWEALENNIFHWNATDIEPTSFVAFARPILPTFSSEDFTVSVTFDQLVGICVIAYGLGIEFEGQEWILEFLTSRDGLLDCGGLYGIQQTRYLNRQNIVGIVPYTESGSLNNHTEANTLTITISNNMAKYEINGQEVDTINLAEHYDLEDGEYIKGPSSISLVMISFSQGLDAENTLEINDFRLEVR